MKTYFINNYNLFLEAANDSEKTLDEFVSAINDFIKDMSDRKSFSKISQETKDYLTSFTENILNKKDSKRLIPIGKAFLIYDKGGLKSIKNPNNKDNFPWVEIQEEFPNTFKKLYKKISSGDIFEFLNNKQNKPSSDKTDTNKKEPVDTPDKIIKKSDDEDTSKKPDDKKTSDNNSSSDNSTKEPTKPSEDKIKTDSKELSGAISIVPAAFFNNVATPEPIEKDKIVEFLNTEISKNKILELKEVKIKVSSNALRNTKQAESLTFEELNNNRFNNIKNLCIEALKASNIKYSDDTIKRITDFSVNVKIGGISTWKATPIGLVGPQSPYSSMVDINGAAFDYYGSRKITMNVKTDLETPAPVKIIMELPNKSVSSKNGVANTKLPKDNTFTFNKGKLINNAIFILNVAPSTVLNSQGIDTALSSCEVIKLPDASGKDAFLASMTPDKLINKTVLVNGDTMWGISKAISKMYEQLNTLNIEWSFIPGEKGKTNKPYVEEEKPKKESTPPPTKPKNIIVEVNCEDDFNCKNGICSLSAG